MRVKVFFYGLFMDERLLAAKGIAPSETQKGFVDGFALRIGERATLVRRAGGRAYGAVMDIDADDVSRLYAEKSVADYAPEPVTVDLLDGSAVDATCYNLPTGKISGANKDYAKALLDLVTGMGFPETYLDEIRRAQR